MDMTKITLNYENMYQKLVLRDNNQPQDTVGLDYEPQRVNHIHYRRMEGGDSGCQGNKLTLLPINRQAKGMDKLHHFSTVPTEQYSL